MTIKGPSDPATSFLMHHGVFVRSARDAARQALFYLGMLYEPWPRRPRWFSDAVEEYRESALHQVKGLVRAVAIPTASTQLIAGKRQDLRASAEAAEVGHAVASAAAWQELRDELAGDKASRISLDGAAELRDKLKRFIRGSKRSNVVERAFQQWLPNALRWLGKHVALILAALIVVGVATRVEVVSGLIRNEGWGTLGYLTVIPLPLIFFACLIAWLRRARPRTVFAWEIGGPPFWGRTAVAPNRLIDRWPEGARLLQAIAAGQAIRLAIYLTWSALAFRVLYRTVGAESTATVFLILFFFYALLLGASTIDFFDFVSSWPVRFLAVAAALLGLVGLRTGLGHEAFFLISTILAAATFVISFLYRRGRLGLRVVAALSALFAVILAVGARSHGKEVWTADGPPLEARLTEADWPAGGSSPIVVVAASGGGSRAAIYTGLTLQALNQDPELREVAAQIQAISSVSGGSLANAAYVERLLPLAGKRPIDWQRRDAALADLVSALSSDFLYPTITGALTPGLTRGGAIEEAWREGPVGLSTTSLQTLVDAWRAAGARETPPLPMPLFNTATLDGHDVVISPLDKDLYTDEQRQESGRDPATNSYSIAQRDGAPTWVFYRDGIYGLEELLPERDVSLAHAVRASANFPFGFPVVRIRTDRRPYLTPAPWSEGAELEFKLTDGGALSNSGMWSLFHLLMNLSRRDDVRERGVLVLVVEASRMPQYAGFVSTVNGLLGTLQDQGGIARNLHERMYDLLERAFGDRIAVAQIDLTPRVSDNVLTTWALDAATRERLETIFKRRWREERDGILGRWRYLEDRMPFEGELIDRRRPPLD